MPILNVNPIVSKHIDWLSTIHTLSADRHLTINKHLNIQPVWVPDIETLTIGTLPLPPMILMLVTKSIGLPSVANGQ